MLRCTRVGRVPHDDAAVASVTAALSLLTCVAVSLGAATSCAPTPAAVQPRLHATTSVSSASAAAPFSVGQHCTLLGLETCFNANDDNCNGLVDEGCGLPNGSLQIVVAWDDADADVDLEVTDPNGEQVEVGRVTALGLTKDHDCPGDGEVCWGQNYEVVTNTAGDGAPLGRYRLSLYLERPRIDGNAVHVRVGGHLGQESLFADVELSPARRRIAWDLFRSTPGGP